MPSTLVHVALAGLLGCALLGPAFGPRALAVVAGAVALIDLDVFVGWYVLGAHRAAFHTLLLPLAGVALLLYDARVRDESLVRERFGGAGVRVAWVSVAAVVLAGIGPDLMTNGVNAFYPLHDQFYVLDGRIRLSDRRGLLQTFVDLSGSTGDGGGVARGSTGETQFYTGADPNPVPGESDAARERVFMVVNSGFELLVVLAGAVTVTARLWDERRSTS